MPHSYGDRTPPPPPGYNELYFPVIEAAERGDVEAVKRLLSRGAYVDAECGDHQSLLHIAVEQVNPELRS